jgi:hypothetical protein
LTCYQLSSGARTASYTPDTLASRHNLAAAYAQAGRTAEAIALNEATLKLKEAKLGPEHPDTIQTRNNLAAAFWRAGRSDRSIPLFEQTLKQRLAKLGPDHLFTLVTQANLGVNYRDGGRPEEGARLMEDALRRAAGRTDALAALAGFREELGLAYNEAGQYVKAESLLRDGLEHARAKFGTEDSRTANALAALGGNLLQQEKFADAEPLLRLCLAIRAKKSPDDWRLFNTQSTLGGALLGQKKLAEAEPLVVQGYEGLKARADKIPARARFRVAEAGERVLRLYAALHQPHKAAALLRKEDLDEMMPNGAAAFAPESTGANGGKPSGGGTP